MSQESKLIPRCAKARTAGLRWLMMNNGDLWRLRWPLSFTVELAQIGQAKSQSTTHKRKPQRTRDTDLTEQPGQEVMSLPSGYTSAGRYR